MEFERKNKILSQGNDFFTIEIRFSFNLLLTLLLEFASNYLVFSVKCKQWHHKITENNQTFALFKREWNNLTDFLGMICIKRSYSAYRRIWVNESLFIVYFRLKINYVSWIVCLPKCENAVCLNAWLSFCFSTKACRSNQALNWT